MPSSLLTLPAEIRNRVYELIVPPSDEQTKPYVFFGEAIQHQPKLLHTCQQLRNELWPMYFSSMSLVVCISRPEIRRFKHFVEATDERLLSKLQELNLTLWCGGYPEFTHLKRCVQPHSALYEIRKSKSGRFEAGEKHGFWIKEVCGQSTFGAFDVRDSLGFSTCIYRGALPVQEVVNSWVGDRFSRQELLALIDRVLLRA